VGLLQYGQACGLYQREHWEIRGGRCLFNIERILWFFTFSQHVVSGVHVSEFLLWSFSFILISYLVVTSSLMMTMLKTGGLDISHQEMLSKVLCYSKWIIKCDWPLLGWVRSRENVLRTTETLNAIGIAWEWPMLHLLTFLSPLVNFNDVTDDTIAQIDNVYWTFDYHECCLLFIFFI